MNKLSADKGYKIPFYAYDGEHLDFPSDSFDVVLIWAQTLVLIYGNERKHMFLKD